MQREFQPRQERKEHSETTGSSLRTNQRIQREKVRWKKSGVGNGNRTRNRRSHSPVLCQLSYSHRRLHYSNFDDCNSDDSNRDARCKNHIRVS
jgi:hypothetical protein